MKTKLSTVNKIKYEKEIQEFIKELNACLLKFETSTNTSLFPFIAYRADIIEMSKLGMPVNVNDFISMSNGQALGIKGYGENSFIDISSFEYQESVNS